MEYKQESVFTRKVAGGRKRLYFIDVKKSRGLDYYLVLTESAKRRDGHGFERHKIFLYKEDLNRFLAGLTESIEKIRELMPNYDFNTFDKRYEDGGDENSDFNENQEEKHGDDMSW